MIKVHETKKAVLLEKEGIKFWIQKRWLKADGSLTPAGEKSFKEAKTVAAEKTKGEKYYKISHLIEKETEKALLIAVNVDLYNIERDVKRTFWFPKSQMQDGFAAWWLLGKKIKEIESEFIYNNQTGGGMVDTDFSEFIYVQKN